MKQYPDRAWRLCHRSVVVICKSGMRGTTLQAAERYNCNSCMRGQLVSWSIILEAWKSALPWNLEFKVIVGFHLSDIDIEYHLVYVRYLARSEVEVVKRDSLIFLTC